MSPIGQLILAFLGGILVGAVSAILSCVWLIRDVWNGKV
jgi:hypothetical protein